MSRFEVPHPILNSPYEKPAKHWYLEEGREPQLRDGRRMALYYYRAAKAAAESDAEDVGTAIELKLVTRIRERLDRWRAEGWPGTTRTTRELLEYWTREGRKHRLFFAQIEAAETVILLTEARADFLHGIDVPWDEPSDDRKAAGVRAFRRYACKMATGSGKTTVMGMLAAWSILNKVHDRADARFSDIVLAVCPNVTIRERLAELDPKRGEASLYRTRDLVPPHQMADLAQGSVVVTNWHAFQPRELQVSGVSARVTKLGKPKRIEETIYLGPKTTTARGKRYMTFDELRRQVEGKQISVIAEETDAAANVIRVRTERYEYLESDAKIVERVLGREVGRKRNVLVFNDEAHHAYRIRKQREEALEVDEEDLDVDFDAELDEEATVWIEGLDRIHKLAGINACVDLSATPYYLATAGSEANRPFPWVVSDFGLVDAIESGLVKIPQFAVRDTSGAAVPGYFNIWRWIVPQLTTSERGGARGSPKPEAVLKWAHTPIAMIGGLWQEKFAQWRAEGNPRPPILILVCKNTKIARVVYEWIAEGNGPYGIPPCRISELRNADGAQVTIRADSKVVSETDSGSAKSDEDAWMRFQLDTAGRLDWPRDSQGSPIYPEGFEALAKKLERPLHPPGRDVRCIVSVGMLTEGWDCNTVTHIIGLRPFMSQLLCEQVVGRGLRRESYAVGPDDKMSEEVAKILGVPFLVIPTKENEGATKAAAVERKHVCALPERSKLEIRYPRVEGYIQQVRNRVRMEWDLVPSLVLDPASIPPEVEMKGLLPTNKGVPSLTGPGRLENVTLNPFRKSVREQELVFRMARDLTSEYSSRASCTVPPHELFPQFVAHVRRYLAEKVEPRAPAVLVDVFLSPYYGWALERLAESVRPDTSAGEAPELPRYEASRGPGSTSEVDFWTARDVRPTTKSHVNFVVADTLKLEQQVGQRLDAHARVQAFVKNAGLGFAIPYLHNGQAREYLPDFIIRFQAARGSEKHLIVETKGYDPLTAVKAEAAHRWVAAVNADGSFGLWSYAVIARPEELDALLAGAAG